MSLNTRIYFSFAAMILIAILLGYTGWSNLASTASSLKNLIEGDLPATQLIATIMQNMESMRGPQRSLLDNNLEPAMREKQHGYIETTENNLKTAIAELETLLAKESKSSEHKDEWSVLQSEWQRETRPSYNAWTINNGDLLGLYREWEKTYILDPEQLLKDLQRFRADHYSLSARLGQMIVAGQASTAPVLPDDDRCAFGQWRKGFDNKTLYFSNNPEMQRAMQTMIDPHKIFHKTAAEVWEKIKADPKGNIEAIKNAYLQNYQAAEQVIGNFAIMVSEVEKARDIYYQAEALSFGKLYQSQVTALDNMTKFSTHNQNITTNNATQAIMQSNSSTQFVKNLTLAALIIGLFMALFVRRTIRTKLTDPLLDVIENLSVQSDSLAHTAENFSQSSTELSQGAADQASSLEETSSTLEEMASMTRKNADNAQQANTFMTNNAQQIGESSEAIRRMGLAMNEINDSSSQISRIIKTIEEIAFQTNLLALNAAVEAARAGEAGKGFAVVADEVRNLAQRSAQASRDTASLIEGTVHRINNGTAITRNIEERFVSIDQTTSQVASMIGGITTATAEQAQGMDSLNIAIARIDRITQDNAANAEETAAACTKLNQDIDNIGEAVNVLAKILGKRLQH